MRRLRRIARGLGWGAAYLVGRLRIARRDEDEDVDPTEREVGPHPNAELTVVVLLGLSGLFGVWFAVNYGVFDDTQLLGISGGGAFAFLAAALVVAGKRVFPQETQVEERDVLVEEEAEEETATLLVDSVEGISRRRLLKAAGGVAGLGVGAIAITPIASLGPNVSNRVDSTPWHKGRRVVSEDGEPIKADDVTYGAFVTGFPEGASTETMGAPIILVRLPVHTIHLPQGRRLEDWAPEGILAYSKICTHAGCAVSLYRYPLYKDVEPKPAFVCPCHFSTFDPSNGAQRIFGPAGRPLPQLPLQIAANGDLHARGGFSGSVGPAWFNVNRGGDR